MKFLCDVHISIRISKFIENLGYECEHVNRILNKWNSKDSEIAKFADDGGYILITKDSDFRDSFFTNSAPKKLIKINLGNISNDDLKNKLESVIYKLENSISIDEVFLFEIF